MRSFPLIALIATVLAPLSAPGAEVGTGLILRMSADGQHDARITRTADLFVPEGQAVSPFLPVGPFTARFEGMLVLEKRSRLVFRMEGAGVARLLIDDEVLVEAVGASNESKRLSSGEHKFVVEYASPPEGAAQLRLFWEERDFGREPMPATVFRHDPDDPELAMREALRSGRETLAERRCLACHQGSGESAMPELLLKAPSLDGVEGRLRQDWLAKWIANPSAVRPSAHMPVVFAEDADQKAADLAAYLSAGAPEIESAPEATPQEVTRGGHLFHQQGCIACHTLEERGDRERIGLKLVGRKFRPGALAQFLREPGKFHEATRMPDFAFTADEAKAVAGFLLSLENDPGAVLPAGNIENGKHLFARAGCLNCHQRDEERSTLPPGKPLGDLKASVCAQVDYGSGGAHPGLEAILASQDGLASLQRAVPAEFAHRQFASLRCNACHTRDGSEPLREKYAAEVEHLKPPAPAANEGKPAVKTGAPPLNHLGLKLRPEWRTKLFAGEIKPKVRQWLPARMPAFPARAQDLSIGFSHVAGLPATSPPRGALDPEKLRIGEAMTSLQGGLACGTCHGIGDKPPIAVFEGEGPNFREAGARLSREYFLLWMNDPPRVWPGTIMPKYATEGKTPLTRHYDGDAHKQFEAIYEYLRALAEK